MRAPQRMGAWRVRASGAEEIKDTCEVQISHKRCVRDASGAPHHRAWSVASGGDRSALSRTLLLLLFSLSDFMVWRQARDAVRLRRVGCVGRRHAAAPPRDDARADDRGAVVRAPGRAFVRRRRRRRGVERGHHEIG